MREIKKNRISSLEESEDGFEEEKPKRHRFGISRSISSKKIQIAIALSILIVALASVLIITHYYNKPDRFLALPERVERDLDLYSRDKSEAPDIESENIHLKRGRDSFFKGYYNDAIAEFSEVIESDATDSEKGTALTYLGIIEDNRGNYSKALAYYERALKYDPNNGVTYRNIAISYKHLNNPSKALEYVKKAISLDKSPNNYILKGNILYEESLYSDAADAYKEAVEIDRENAIALYNLAQALSKKGDKLLAIDYFRRSALADKIGKIAYMAYSKLGLIAIQDNDFILAEKYLKHAISINPNDATDHYNLAVVYLKRENEEQALKELIIAEGLTHEDANLLENLGTTYAAIGKYDKSIAAFEKLLKLNGSNVKVLSMIGDIYFKKGDIEEALTAYERITEIEPASENARIAFLNIGNIYDEMNRYEDAIEAYKNALTINPKDDAALYNLGIAYKHIGDNEHAIEAWQKASDLNPDNHKPQLALADLLYEEGYIDEAIEEYKEATERWPDLVEAHFSLATIYHKKGLLDYAKKRYEKVVEINRSKELTRKAYVNLVIISSNNAKDTKAVEGSLNYIQKALLIKPGDSESLLSLGVIYYKKGSYEKALETFYQVAKGTDDGELTAKAYNNIGKCHFKKREYQKALKSFNLALKYDPTNEEIRINRKSASQAYESELER